MPTLNWLGKDKIINHANKIPFHVLNHKYNFQAKINSLFENSEINTGNKIIHGDNLIALKSLLPEYAGKIKCVYIDPPYNTGNENWVYNDNVNDPKFKKWLGEVVGKEGEDLTRHDKWLCMMYPRLQLLKQLLSDDGAIFISIDDNEQANLKLLCDEIFGANNFVANIAWKRKKELSPDSKNVSIQGEYILCYSKSENLQLASEKLSDEYIRKSYKTPTPEFPLDYWRPVPITVSKGLSGGGYEYTITTPTGKEHTKLWAYPEHSYQDLLKNNRVYFGKDGNAIPQRVMYLSESQGKPTSNYWDN
nr:site-specific DNA-methyltransferase [Synergistaceae bacterium]